MADREPFVVPEGWELVTKVKGDGTVVKYYTNILGQKFYSEEDLLRNIKDAKERGLSIYAPDFNPSDVGTSNSQRKKKPKVGEASTKIWTKEKKSSIVKRVKDPMKQKEVQKKHEPLRVNIGSHVPDPRTTTFRTSRRLAGLEPELTPEFEFNKPLEYIIKDKHKE